MYVKNVLADIRQKLVEIDGWLRNLLHYCIWIPMMISGEETRELISNSL